MDKWFTDILPDKDPYHNRGRDQMRKKGVRNSSACRGRKHAIRSSEDRIACFLPLCYYPLVEPRLRIRFRRIRSLCLQIILVILVLFTGTRIPDPLFPHLVPPAIMVRLRIRRKRIRSLGSTRG
jgi:hypothetical protein